VREERVVLEHHAEAALLRRQLVDAQLVEPDAARAEGEQPGDAVERRGLAAARGTEERDELAAADGDRQSIERRDLALAVREAARDAVESQLAEVVLQIRNW
jgi:hypothetical protein